MTEKRLPVVVSNSSIQTFKACRRQYWLKYYRRLKPKTEAQVGPLALGSRVHLALEQWYAMRLEYPDTDIGLQALLDIWAELVEDDRLLVIATGGFLDDFNKEVELGRIMLEGYVQWIEEEGIDALYEVIGLEETLEYPILDGEVLVAGKVDQRLRRKVDGALLVRDFKTSAAFADLLKTIEMQEQFLLYMTLEQLLKSESDRVAGAVVTALRKVKRTAASKPPYYTQVEVEHNVFTLRNFFKRLIGECTLILDMHKQLDNGADHQMLAFPSPGRDCSWRCEFAAGCAMFDNGGAVEEWLADNFQESDPYAYYGDSSPIARLENETKSKEKS